MLVIIKWFSQVDGYKASHCFAVAGILQYLFGDNFCYHSTLSGFIKQVPLICSIKFHSSLGK